MTFFFFSKNPAICEKIAEKLEIIDSRCFIFDKASKLTETILEDLYPPDMLVIDYLAFPHHFFDVYAYMKTFNKFLPLIYYNDPFAPPEKRALYWKSQIYLSGYEGDIDKFKKYLLVIADAVASPAIFPYISAIQPPLPYPPPEKVYAPYPTQRSESIMVMENSTITNSNTNTNANTNANANANANEIYFMRKKYSIPPGIFNIFLWLYERMDTVSEIEELKKIYRPNKKDISENSIKIAITRLRNTLETITERKMDLIYTGTGYKLVLI